MNTFKKAKIVMLPTNQKAGLGSIYKRIKDDEIGSINEFDKIGNLYINKNPNVQKSNSNFEAQHLYIISDDEIKEGDYYIIDTGASLIPSPTNASFSFSVFLSSSSSTLLTLSPGSSSL